MNRKIYCIEFYILVVIILITMGVKSTQNRASADDLPIPAHHPKEELSEKPDCTACHSGASDTVMSKPVKVFNHSKEWIHTHRFISLQADPLCQSCHNVSFCADCHVRKDELMPSLKHADRPDRQLPHQGNYLIRHKIDGRIDPSGCYRCHGRSNNGKCRECHRNVQ